MQHKNSNRMLEKVSEDGEKERERARERKWKWKCWSLSHVQLFTWNVARQAPLSMEFSRQEFWSGLPFPPPRDHPNSRIKPSSPTMQRILYHLATAEPLNKKACLLWLSGRSPVLHLTKDLQMSEAVTLKCINSLHKYLSSDTGTEIRRQKD